jgi:hypothetical protein
MNGFMEGKEKLSDDDPLARFRVKPGETLNEEDSQELLQIMLGELAVWRAEEEANKPKKPPSPDVDILFNHGTFQQQIEMQMAMLTQALASCMLYASSAGRDVLEEEPQTRSGFWSGTRPAAQRTTNWPQVRSAQLHDAARLAEASARLVNGYAKFRSHVDQQFSLRHTASHNKRGKKLRVSTITHRFSAPRDEAIPDARHLNAEINNDLRPENNA